jgi:NADPH2:quinone reductase
VAYATSYIALKEKARLRAGETLLVHGASGGVGLTAVELGHAAGAVVIATASSPMKLSIAKSRGATHLVNSSEPGLDKKVR